MIYLLSAVLPLPVWRMLPKKAGVSKATLYLYFSGKEELFKAVVRDTLLPKLAAAEDIVKDNFTDSMELFRPTLFIGFARKTPSFRGCRKTFLPHVHLKSRH